uniref:Cilia- and flagella-associated protein 45 n=1 Tax=Anser cygnoides TaxID=8845 RepID=A0A8B9E3Q1_ANSCY
MEPWHRYPAAAEAPPGGSPRAIQTRCWAAVGPGGPRAAFQPQPSRAFSPLPMPSLGSQSWGCRGTKASPLPKLSVLGLGFVREHQGRSPTCVPATSGLGRAPELGTETGRGWWLAGHSERRPSPQSLRQSRPGTPIVILRDVQSAPKTASAGEHKPETIRLITKDFVRDLVVPMENPAASLIIGREDFQRLTEASRVLSKEEREAKLAALRAEKEAVLEAVGERKAAAKQRAALQRQKGKLSDLEEEAKERAQHLLQRASRMRTEQEDEIKEFSELILGAKCHMVRDAQILEKQLVAKELEEEEKRLAEMMEVERQKANEMQEELERRRKQELIRGRQELVKQMEKNAEERALRAEQRDQETREMLQHLEQLKLEDLKDLERRQEQQRKIQAEIKRINDENRRCKEEQLRQERMADEKILEYQRQKMEREAEFEAEQERIRREKEKEMARLRAMQERALDHQAERDALRAKRSQEAAEREWRRKEKEAARRKAELEEQLKRSRLEQIAAREHRMAVQVQQDRDEFERILRAQQEQMEKEKAEAERRVALQRAHAGDVRRQMQEWRQRRVRERAAAFEECQRLQEEARRRSQRITQLKEKKLQELRCCSISACLLPTSLHVPRSRPDFPPCPNPPSHHPVGSSPSPSDGPCSKAVVLAWHGVPEDFFPPQSRRHPREVLRPGGAAGLEQGRRSAHAGSAPRGAPTGCCSAGSRGVGVCLGRGFYKKVFMEQPASSVLLLLRTCGPGAGVVQMPLV